MVEEEIYMQTGMFTKESGLMTRPMGKVFIHIKTEHDMRVVLKIIYNMGKELKHEPMVLDMKVTISKGKNMEMVFLFDSIFIP